MRTVEDKFCDPRNRRTSETIAYFRMADWVYGEEFGLTGRAADDAEEHIYDSPLLEPYCIYAGERAHYREMMARCGGGMDAPVDG